VQSLFLLFIMTNLLMLPLGWLCIKVAARLLRTPRNLLMPVILLFCVVGAFAINNSPFDLWILVVAGLIGWFLETHGFPIVAGLAVLVLLVWSVSGWLGWRRGRAAPRG
jgi:TctA family transporter